MENRELMPAAHNDRALTASEFFSRAQERLTFDVPAGFADPTVIPRHDQQDVDVTVPWPETLSPFVTVAKLRLPQQDIGSDDNLERMDATSMSALRVTEEHRPLGNIMRARKEVYRQSSILRHQMNHQVRKEPKDLAEVFGK